VTLSPRLRKSLLTLHVASSVGWFGVVCAFLVLSLAGVRSDDEETVRAVYIAMDVIGWGALVPLALLSLLTGVLQSLGTTWGLLRHYWVVFKLLITVVASVVLVLYTGTLAALAAAAGDATFRGISELRSTSPVVHSAAGLMLLVIAMILSVFKPRGLTVWGWRASRRSK
jgi:hypothetical protein